MKIAAIALNPAIDETVRIDGFQVNTVNRGRSMQFHAGGKGVNVASFLADSGYSVIVTGFLGEENAAIFEQFFARKRITDACVRLPGDTRISVKIVDELNHQTTDINMPGLAPSVEALARLHDTIEQIVADCDWFVLSGALPPGVPDTLYATIIERLRQRGKKVVLDTSGTALHHGVLAHPTIVKPNLAELQELAGFLLDDEEAIERAAHSLLDNMGIELVVVSMGERGALFVEQDTTLLAVPPSVSVKSTVGAGDAMVAGLIAAKIQGLNLTGCARLASAYALGRITQIGSQLPTPAAIQAYIEQVAIHLRSSVSRSV
jgi:1-phosphofructokinase